MKNIHKKSSFVIHIISKNKTSEEDDGEVENVIIETETNVIFHA